MPTMFICSDGGQTSRFKPSVVVSRNVTSQYPIRGIVVIIHGTLDRTGSNEWINTTVLYYRLRAWTMIRHHSQNLKIVPSAENCNGSMNLQEQEHICGDIDLEINYSPPSVTHFVQASDNFVIHKIRKITMHRIRNLKDGTDKKIDENVVQGRIPFRTKPAF